MAAHGLGVVEIVREGPRRWRWVRRNQAGLVVFRSPEELGSRRAAERSARRANGPALPVLVCAHRPRLLRLAGGAAT